MHAVIENATNMRKMFSHIPVDTNYDLVDDLQTVLQAKMMFKVDNVRRGRSSVSCRDYRESVAMA